MGDKKSFADKFRNLFPGGDKKNSKSQYVVVLFLIGIAFMIVSNFFSQSQRETMETINDINGSEGTEVFKQTDENQSTIDIFEQEYENQLKEALETIVGVDDVTVVVNVDSTSEKILEKNTVTQSQSTTESDRNGGTREVGDQSTDEQVVIIRKGDQEAPIVIKVEKPEIRGVLIVAKGVENIQIKKMMTDAVTRVLDVPSHRVAILPKKSKED
ncbi:stage III sporulation protein AG [Bacillus sp. FJAT-47783]|uniref:stage III sporulation protein AG n=1 Tax=Bacillus sp. FJAT-47783 TaxID=2922712 RepID=UPI001FAD790B|nr:stage III sporulation protein AG [Bacillus sp. FJAT-47783]